MLVEHRGRSPEVHPSAWVAPTAVVCGDVSIGADTRVLFNAVVTAEDGRVEIGERCVVVEHALVRRRAAHPEDIWAIQRELDLPGTVYGEARGDDLMARVMPRQSAWLAAHRDDRVL